MRGVRALLSGLGLLALAVAAAAAGWLLHTRVPASSPAAAPVALAAATVPRPAVKLPPAAAPAATKPAFDIVRVGPDGRAVLAGRAAPSAQVTVRDRGQALGVVEADRHGEWVLVPDRPLPPGGQELTLSSKLAGGPAVAGEAPVLLAMPPARPAPHEQVAAAKMPLAVLAPADAAPQVLEAPAGAGAKEGRLGVGALDYNAKGAVRLSGTAPPGATVRLYVDNAKVGDARAGADGRWTLTPPRPITSGGHTIRADQLGADGQVVARLALPFRLTLLPAVAPGEVTVRPGQSLWLIARHAYGQGIRYTVIYAANRAEIRNPDLIYPGQVFAVPELSGQPR